MKKTTIPIQVDRVTIETEVLKKMKRDGEIKAILTCNEKDSIEGISLNYLGVKSFYSVEQLEGI